MSDLADRLYRSLADAVAKLELDVMATQAIHDACYPGAHIPCSCDAISSGPGCKPCIVKRGREAMAEYEANDGFRPLSLGGALPDCSTCGKAAPDIAMSVDFDGTRTAQCRACYVAAREREMAGAL